MGFKPRKDYPGQGDYWADFLHFRARAIRALRAEGRDFAEIARTLNLGDGTHAQRIFEATR